MPKRAFIPNAITMTNMILGFLAIIYASMGTSSGILSAGVLVFVASFFDFFDGAAARALNVESEIGMQLDSLADGISYGIAPGVIAYKAYLYRLPEIVYDINTGMLVAVIFPVAAIYRLARFNVTHDAGGFTGLPSPAGGIFVSSIPTLAYITLPWSDDVHYIMPLKLFIALYILTAFLMDSHIDYSKMFANVLKGSKIVLVLLIMVIILLLFFFKMWAVFVVTGLYIFSGLIRFFITSRRTV